MNRKTLITLFAALVLGAAGAVSSAQAGDRDDGPSGGYSVGPLGQVFGNSYTWRDTGANAYSFVPVPARHGHKHVRTR